MNLFQDMKSNMMKDELRDLISRSSKATCGIMEREVIVKSENMGKRIRQLKDAGFVIVGTSHGDTRMKKIWFIRAGGF